MKKYQKPIRDVRDEIFDAEQTYQQRQELVEAYKDFWKTLDDNTKEELDTMLM